MRDFLLFYFSPKDDYESSAEYYALRILIFFIGLLVLFIALLLIGATKGIIAIIALGFYFIFKGVMFVGTNILYPYLKKLEDENE